MSHTFRASASRSAHFYLTLDAAIKSKLDDICSKTILINSSSFIVNLLCQTSSSFCFVLLISAHLLFRFACPKPFYGGSRSEYVMSPPKLLSFRRCTQKTCLIDSQNTEKPVLGSRLFAFRFTSALERRFKNILNDILIERNFH